MRREIVDEFLQSTIQFCPQAAGTIRKRHAVRGALYISKMLEGLAVLATNLGDQAKYSRLVFPPHSRKKHLLLALHAIFKFVAKCDQCSRKP